jgi:hypothetical protein
VGVNYQRGDDNNRRVRPPVFREANIVLLCLVCGAILILIYIATVRWYFSMGQIRRSPPIAS